MSFAVRKLVAKFIIPMMSTHTPIHLYYYVLLRVASRELWNHFLKSQMSLLFRGNAQQESFQNSSVYHCTKAYK